MKKEVKVIEFIVQCLAALVISFLGVQSGFIVSWPSYTIANFRSNETVLSEPMSSFHVSLLGSLPNLGSVFICPFVTYAFNTFGRKYATMLFGLPFVIAWIIISLTSNIALVLFVMAFAGFGISGQNASMIYISEIAHDSIRGGLTACATAGYFSGILISYILGGNLSYMQVVYIHLSLSALTVVLIMLLKESPVYLVMVGKEQEAAKSISFYKRIDVKSKEVEAEIAKIKLELDPRLETMLQAATDSEVASELLKKEQSVTQPPAREYSWKFLIRSKSSQQALFTVLMVMFLTIMMGGIVLQVYAEPLFMEALPTLPPNLCAILVSLLFLVSSVICIFLIDRFGRKFLLMVTSAVSGVATLLLGCQLQFHWAPHWVTALLIYVYGFAYTSGCVTIPFVLAAEVFLPEVRSLCNSITLAFVGIFNFVTLVIFNPLVESVGLYLVFYLFSVVCFASAGYSQFCVPETKGLSVAEIQKLFVKERRKSVVKT